MKSLLIALAMLGPAAFADIPRPPGPRPIPRPVPMPLPAPAFEQVRFEGRDALEFAASLRGETVRGSALRTGSVVYKVYRSSQGTLQSVCEIRTSLMNPGSKSASCTITKSRNGRPIPPFRPVIRMG